MKLTDTRPDQNGVIRKIGGDAHFMNRITAIGVKTVRNDRKMPVLLYLRETLIAVNRKDAERIEVEAQ